MARAVVACALAAWCANPGGGDGQGPPADPAMNAERERMVADQIASRDVREPLAVRIRGAPFFDGQHRRTTRKRDVTDGGHGRCNSSLRALWEIHPVYAVSELRAKVPR